MNVFKLLQRMSPEAQKLVALMQANRQRHGKIWRKVRRDRIHKLFPEHDDIAIIEQIIKEAEAHGHIKSCAMILDWDNVSAIKLTKFEYKPRFLSFHEQA